MGRHLWCNCIEFVRGVTTSLPFIFKLSAWSAPYIASLIGLANSFGFCFGYVYPRRSTCTVCRSKWRDGYVELNVSMTNLFGGFPDDKHWSSPMAVKLIYDHGEICPRRQHKGTC